MNSKNRERWVMENRMLNVKNNSVLVPESALYHKTKSVPHQFHLGREKLYRHHCQIMPFDERMIKSEPIKLKRKWCETYQVDTILTDHGHPF